jgi:hypothetical protein
MNHDVYRMYAHSQAMIKKAEAKPEDLCEEHKNLVADMKLAQTILEEAEPGYLARYKMEQAMWDTFTPEQRDFICAQIGHWYCMWENKMWVEDKPNQHWLVRAKEQLKIMVCGE